MTLKTYMNSCSNYYTQCAFVQPDGSVIVNSGEIDFREEELLKMLHLRSQSEIDIEVKFDKQSKTLLNQLIKEKKVKILDLAGVKFYKV